VGVTHVTGVSATRPGALRAKGSWGPRVQVWSTSPVLHWSHVPEATSLHDERGRVVRTRLDLAVDLATLAVHSEETIMDESPTVAPIGAMGFQSARCSNNNPGATERCEEGP